MPLEFQVTGALQGNFGHHGSSANWAFGIDI